MQKILKTLVKIPLVLFGIYILFLNVKLYHSPTCEIDSNQNLVNIEVLDQLEFLKTAFKMGAGNRMQRLFPEGYIFFNVLYGLAWAEVAENFNKDGELYAEAIIEIDKALEKNFSEKGKSIFPKTTPLRYGAFYQGWSNYLLAKKFLIQNPSDRDSSEIQLFQKNCDSIALAFQNSYSPFLESYHDSSWPADNLVCIASLALYDQIFDSKYSDVIENWLQKVKNNLDENGLIPHSTQARTGKVREFARGSSQSLMLIFLKEIDSNFAQNQFEIYEELFVDYRLGLPGIREYPKGTEGGGDVDSGPVIWGIGGSASVVGMRTLKLYGNGVGQGIQNAVEAFGMGFSGSSGKYYLFGKLPMLDAFIAWSNSINCKIELQNGGNWSWKFQLILLLLLGLLGYLVWKI